MDKSELTHKIKDKANELGFPLVGVTTAEPPEHLNFFLSWLESGYNASMDWIGTERSLEGVQIPIISFQNANLSWYWAALIQLPEEMLKAAI